MLDDVVAVERGVGGRAGIVPASRRAVVADGHLAVVVQRDPCVAEIQGVVRKPQPQACPPSAMPSRATATDNIGSDRGLTDAAVARLRRPQGGC